MIQKSKRDATGLQFPEFIVQKIKWFVMTCVTVCKCIFLIIQNPKEEGNKFI